MTIIQRNIKQRISSYIYLCLFPIALTPLEAKVANAVSQSNNGSVNNMAIQSLTGNMTTHQFGNNIVCQGATLTFSPFVTFGSNYRKPFEHYYDTRTFYDPTDAIMMMVYQIIREIFCIIKKIILVQTKIVFQ